MSAAVDDLREALAAEREAAHRLVQKPLSGWLFGRFMDAGRETDLALAAVAGELGGPGKDVDSRLPSPSFDVGDRVLLLPGARASWETEPSRVFRAGDIGTIKRVADVDEDFVVEAVDGLTDYIHAEYLAPAPSRAPRPAPRRRLCRLICGEQS